MRRIKIQMPDDLYDAAIALARRNEVSFNELVRRSIECLLETSPEAMPAKEWTLLEAHHLGARKTFNSGNWREPIYSDMASRILPRKR